MQDRWDEEKYQEIEISPFSTSILRDYGIYFMAMIEFDIFLGPVVIFKEIMPGSTFINQLRDTSKLTEVYSGLARTGLDSLSIDEKEREEKIVISRVNPDTDEDIVTVFLISCLPDSDLISLQRLAEIVINNSQGNSQRLQNSINHSIRKWIAEKKQIFETGQKEINLIIHDSNRHLKSLKLINIRGFFLVNMEKKLADFRFLPVWIEDKKMDPKEILGTIESKLANLSDDEIETVFVKGIPFITLKLSQKKVYYFLALENSGIRSANSISNWFSSFCQIINEEWQTASSEEIFACLTLLDEADKRGTPENIMKSMMFTLIRSSRLRPMTISFEEFNLDPPQFIPIQIWRLLRNLDGSVTLSELSNIMNDTLSKTLMIIRWTLARNLVQLFEGEVK